MVPEVYWSFPGFIFRIDPSLIAVAGLCVSPFNFDKVYHFPPTFFKQLVMVLILFEDFYGEYYNSIWEVTKRISSEWRCFRFSLKSR
jgi:hypothetical protein